jgi:hypothetical protein
LAIALRAALLIFSVPYFYEKRKLIAVSLLLIANLPRKCDFSHLIATFLAMTRENGKGCRYR